VKLAFIITVGMFNVRIIGDFVGPQLTTEQFNDEADETGRTLAAALNGRFMYWEHT
jgi:hypothetical protein